MLTICGYTAIGTKYENEDSLRFGQPSENSCFAVLCDGLGGHGGGREASTIAADCVAACASADALPSAEQLTAALNLAEEGIAQTRSAENTMKTTCVCLFIRGNRALWAHIGDSRLYHFHNGELADITLDHSLGQLAVKMEEITRREIPAYPGRSKITRVIGSGKPEPELHPEAELAPGRHAFLLCSDGLWERLQEDEILLDLHKSATPEQWIYSLRVRAQMRRWTEVDNNTAAAIFLDV